MDLESPAVAGTPACAQASRHGTPLRGIATTERRAPSSPAGSASAACRSHGPSKARPSMTAMRQHLLDLGNGLGWIQVLGTGVGAVHDGVAAIQAEWIFEL